MKKQKWEQSLRRVLKGANDASHELKQLAPDLKRKVLRLAAQLLEKERKSILRENLKDLKEARASGLSAVMIDRLTLTDQRLRAMAEGIRTVVSLHDPIGKVMASWRRPNGLKISKVSVPIGVILIIYESRPNVTIECAALCFKSGNAVILRGGKESFYSNQALVAVFEKALRRYKLPVSAVNLVQTTDRKAVDFLLTREQEIHLVIPRGGESLIRKVVALSKIPVIKHYQGICHVYVDKQADLKKALAIAYNAKMQRPGVCNAMETLLVHRQVAATFLPALANHLRRGGCEVRADKVSRRYIPWAKPAAPEDFGHEFLDKILAVKVVAGADEAADHIRRFGSGHTDAIVTQSKKTGKQFAASVDSSSVMINASTRFADGFEYGLGAEIGISTDKIHARGPMGLEGLTSYKYLVEGNGQVRL